MLLTNLIYFIFACGLLIVCGVYLVKSLSKISKFLGISQFSAAFIIMAFATSIPELFVGVSSALAGNPALSLGNIIGANIINLTLISGIIILSSREIKFKSKRIGGDVYFMLLTLLLVIVLYVLGKELSRIDGLILVSLFSLHSYQILKRRKKYSEKIKNGRTVMSRFYWLMVFLLALVGLFIASNLVVKSAIDLAVDFDLPEIMIGLFFISFATSLPELVFGLSASKLKHKEMAIGDQIGSVVTNAGLILGLVCLIHPIKTQFVPFLVSSIFMFVSAFIFVTFIKTGGRLEKMEGISLIFLYILFIVIQVFAGIV